MHQAENTKVSLTYIKLAIRAFFLGILLLGNAFIFVSAITSNQVFAKNTAKVSQQHLSGLQPHTVASVNKFLHPEKPKASQEQNNAQGRQTLSLQSRGKTSVHPATTLIPPQDVSIAANVQGGPTYQVGQTLTFNLVVTNISSTTTLDATSGVRVIDLIPLGLANITGTASGWAVTTTSPNGPSLIQGTYTGPPIAPGASFSSISVSGILTSDAAPVFTDTAGVADNANTNLNFATFSLNVSPSTQTVTATTVPTATPTTNPDVSMSFNVHGGPTYQVGQTLTFDLVLTNTSATILDATSGVGTGTFAPAGLSNIVAAGSGWTLTATSPNSPTLITAAYSGPPVLPGQTFAPFEISGTLTQAAAPVYTEQGGAGDIEFSTSSSYANFTIDVAPASPTPTATVPPSPTATVPPSPTATVPPSPTATVPPSPTVTVSPSPTVTVSPSPTVTVSPSPTVTVSPSPTMTVSPSPTATTPQLSIVNSSPDGNTYTVGQTVHSILTVTNLPASNVESQSITVQAVFPVGLNTIVATGSDWNISLSSTTSPTLMTATYVGPYPVEPGTTLPPISINGVLTLAAGPSFTTSATVSSADNPNPALSTSTQTILVLGSVSPTLTTTVSAPSVSLLQTNLGGDHFDVGDKVTYMLIASDAPTSGTVAWPITVSEIMPVGLSSITWDAPGWSVSISDHSSPAVLTATYSGLYPVPSGQVLTPIMVTGTLNRDAVPSLTTTATVDTLGNSNLFTPTTTDTIFVTEQSNNNQHNNNNNDNNDSNQHNNNDNNNNQQNNNNNQQNNNNNNNCNCNNHAPGLPGTGSDPLGADVSAKG